MSKSDNYFSRPATEAEIQAFKKAMTLWGAKQPGKVEDKLGDNIKIKECMCGQMDELNFDILVEERTRDTVLEPSEKSKTPLDPKVKLGVLDIWSFPTPDGFAKVFNEGKGIIRWEETAHYVACGTCQESGKVRCHGCSGKTDVACPQCKEAGGFKCHDCNGHGVLSCRECRDTGTASYDCDACGQLFYGRGNVACGPCQGSGLRHNPNGKDFSCDHCNGSGKQRCGKCHGTGKLERTCRNCGGRELVCGTCRRSGWLTCGNCRGNKRVGCPTCGAKGEVGCKYCGALGGNKKTEVVHLKTEIHKSHVFLSPVENIRQQYSGIGLDQIGSHYEPVVPLSKVDEICTVEELRPYAHDLVNKVKQTRPPSTLLEKFHYKHNSFLELKFEYEGKEFLAYADFRKQDPVLLSGLDSAVHFNVNPLADRIAGIKDKVKGQAGNARGRRDPKGLFAAAELARELGFADLAATWKDEAEKLVQTLEHEATVQFVKTVKTPVTLALPTLIWAAAGFIIPMPVHYLVIWNIIAIVLYRKRSFDFSKLEVQKKEFRFNLMILLGGILLIIALGYGMNKFSDNDAMSNAFKSGIEL